MSGIPNDVIAICVNTAIPNGAISRVSAVKMHFKWLFTAIIWALYSYFIVFLMPFYHGYKVHLKNTIFAKFLWILLRGALLSRLVKVTWSSCGYPWLDKIITGVFSTCGPLRRRCFCLSDEPYSCKLLRCDKSGCYQYIYSRFCDEQSCPTENSVKVPLSPVFVW